MEKYTKDYGCIIVDNENIYSNSMEKIMFFKAENLNGKSFYVGSLGD